MAGRPKHAACTPDGWFRPVRAFPGAAAAYLDGLRLGGPVGDSRIVHACCLWGTDQRIIIILSARSLAFDGLFQEDRYRPMQIIRGILATVS